MWDILRKSDGYLVGRVSEQLVGLHLNEWAYYNPKTGEVIY